MTLRTLVGITLCVSLLAAGWLLLQPPSRSGDGEARAGADALSGEHGEIEGDEESRVLEAPRVEEGAAVQPQAPRVDAPEREHAFLSHEEAWRAPRLVTGRLVDDDQRALVGQVLEVQYLDAVRDWLRPNDREGHRLRTGPGGRFRFPATTGKFGWVLYAVERNAPWVPLESDADLEGANRNDLGTVVLPPMRAVVVEVTDPSGAPAVDYAIDWTPSGSDETEWLLAPSGSMPCDTGFFTIALAVTEQDVRDRRHIIHRVRTDAQGRAALRGRFRSFEAAVHEPGFGTHRLQVDGEAAAKKVVSFQLHARTPRWFQVLEADGRPAVGAEVWAGPCHEWSSPSVVHRIATVPADGWVRLAAESNKVTVAARRAPDAPFTLDRVSTREQPAPGGSNALVLPPPGGCTVVVLDEANRPIDGATVTATTLADVVFGANDEGLLGVGHGTSLGDGTYRIEDVPASAGIVKVERSGFRTGFTELDREDGLPEDPSPVVLHTAKTLTVIVEAHEDGPPVPGVSVHLGDCDDHGFFPVWGMTDQEGLWQTELACSGMHSVEVKWASGKRHATWDGESSELRIALGIREPTEGRVTWRGRPVAGAVIEFRPPRGNPRVEALTDAQGRFRAWLVAPGRYGVHVVPPQPLSGTLALFRGLDVSEGAARDAPLELELARSWAAPTATLAIECATDDGPLRGRLTVFVDVGSTDGAEDKELKASWPRHAYLARGLPDTPERGVARCDVMLDEHGRATVELPAGRVEIVFEDVEPGPEAGGYAERARVVVGAGEARDLTLP